MDTVLDTVLEDMVVTILALPSMEDTVLDTVSGIDQLILKLRVPLDTDMAPAMVLVDMEVMVLALPAMEVTVLDTVSGRDPLMTSTDVATVDVEDTDTVVVYMDTEINCIYQST